MMASRIKDEFFARSAPPDVPMSEAEEFDWMSSMQDWREKIETTITERPGMCLGIALATGLLIGWWTKRS